MIKLRDKVAVITGATSGVGFEISLRLIEEGVKVYLIGRSFEELEKTLPDNKKNKKINFIHADLENKKEINKIIKKINCDTVDILIHSAGVISMGLLEEDSVEKLDQQYKINVRTPYELTQRLLAKIKKAKGEIIFINSTAGLYFKENTSQYAGTKHAIKAIAEILRKELITHRIKVANIFLGATDTPMQEKVQRLKGLTYKSEKFMNAQEISNIIIYILNLPKNINMTDLTLLPL